MSDRRVRVENVMGTVFSLDLREPWIEPDSVEPVFAWLHEVDARFSTYRHDSEISRIRRGEIDAAVASADVRLVLALCSELERDTAGAFRYGEGALLDPSGVVKGWAAEVAASRLAQAGARNFVLNAGGDVVAAGRPHPDRRWSVGVRHPERSDLIVASLDVEDCAVATSGHYERGSHIHDSAGHPIDDPAFLSLTVIGPSLTFADAYATAAFAMGEEGPEWVASIPGYTAYTVDRQLRTRAVGELAPVKSPATVYPLSAGI